MPITASTTSNTKTSLSHKRQAGSEHAGRKTRTLKDLTFTNLPTSSINELCTLSLKTSVPTQKGPSSTLKTELAYPIQFNLSIRSRPKGALANTTAKTKDSTTDDDDCLLSPTLEKELFGSLSPADGAVKVFKGAEKVQGADECAIEDDDVEMSTEQRQAFARKAADAAAADAFAMPPPKLPLSGNKKTAYQKHQRNKSSSVTGFRATNNKKSLDEKPMRLPEYDTQDWNPTLKHSWAAERARRPSIAQTPKCGTNGNSFKAVPLPSSTGRGRTERRDSNVSMRDVSRDRSQSQVRNRRKSLRETLGLVGVCHPLASPANFDSVLMPPPPPPPPPSTSAKKPTFRPRQC